MLLGLLRTFKRPAGQAAAREPEATADSAPDVTPVTAPAEPSIDDPYTAARQAEERGDIDGMLEIFRRHVHQHPDDADAIAHLGGQLVQHGQPGEADRFLQPALQRFPDNLPLLLNSARSAQAQMRTDEAIALYRLVLAADPTLAMARYLLSKQLMLKGAYREGLLLFRSRNELDPVPNRHWPREVPRWEGQPLEGKRLLVWLDWGGLGDELQFARYLPALARQCRPARLVVGCSSQGERLYASIPGVDEATSLLSDTQVDYQAAFLDLPIIFGTPLESPPTESPYLQAPGAEKAAFAQKLAALPGRKIGLCWSSGFWGGTKPSEKSIPLQQLGLLARLPDTTFISLQKGPGRAEMPCPGLDIVDLDNELRDLADTAALIETLDLVISVDTAVAHLAGALGKPVLMLLIWDSGNFWLLDREDSPWYPSMRIVRQPARGDWKSVAAEVFELLSAKAPLIPATNHLSAHR